MKAFLSEDFLLNNEAGRTLYNDFAKNMPIFDYHCHLPVQEIAENRRFENLTRIWLNGDHYKWRAMRANGVPERYITGDANDYEKFQAWAATVPRTIRNPLFHWTHLELKRTFGIAGKILSAKTADEIYRSCSEMLRSDSHTARSILLRMNVRVVFTTDDPVDSLKYHRLIREDRSFPITVLPAFRPDRALGVETPEKFNLWVDQLEAATDLSVGDFKTFIEALRKRHHTFHEAGCRISDHGIEYPYVEKYSPKEISAIFAKVRSWRLPTPLEIRQFRAAMLLEFAKMDCEKRWVQQFHLGALRNVRTRAMELLGPDTGYDAIGDFETARSLARFLDNLDREDGLARTILYPMNPRDNELISAMIGCFQDGTVRGKIQFGPAWWFNDHKEGMERQMNALSYAGLLSCFTGMVTDSRSFLSYSRHEYFRRVLCNLLGNDVENGEIPDDLELIGDMVKDICYRNAEAYFGINESQVAG